jgi:hypothetical protein
MPRLVKLDPALKAALEIVYDLAVRNALTQGLQPSDELEEEAQRQSDALALVASALLVV